jgi:hypothetical protein
LSNAAKSFAFGGHGNAVEIVDVVVVAAESADGFVDVDIDDKMHRLESIVDRRNMIKLIFLVVGFSLLSTMLWNCG